MVNRISHLTDQYLEIFLYLLLYFQGLIVALLVEIVRK